MKHKSITFCLTLLLLSGFTACHNGNDSSGQSNELSSVVSESTADSLDSMVTSSELTSDTTQTTSKILQKNDSSKAVATDTIQEKQTAPSITTVNHPETGEIVKSSVTTEQTIIITRETIAKTAQQATTSRQTTTTATTQEIRTDENGDVILPEV